MLYGVVVEVLAIDTGVDLLADVKLNVLGAMMTALKLSMSTS